MPLARLRSTWVVALHVCKIEGDRHNAYVRSIAMNTLDSIELVAALPQSACTWLPLVLAAQDCLSDCETDVVIV